jgi:hypothetical protein
MDHANNVVNSFIYKLVCTSFDVHFLYSAILIVEAVMNGFIQRNGTLELIKCGIQKTILK